METTKVLFSTEHLVSPLTHRSNGEEILYISEKKTQIIAFSIIFGVFTLGVGGVALFYLLAAKYKVNKLESLERKKIDELSTQEEGFFLPLPNEVIKKICDYLPVKDLQNVGKVNKHGRDCAENALIRRQKIFGFKNEEVNQLDAFYFTLFKSVTIAVKNKIIPDSKIVYLHKGVFSDTIDEEETIKNLKNLDINQADQIYTNLVKKIKNCRTAKKDYEKIQRMVCCISRFISVNNKEAYGLQVNIYSQLLYSIIGNGYIPPVIEDLLEMGANPNLLDAKGYTALHNVLKFRNLKTVKLLLDKFLDVDIQANQHGFTALHLAVAFSDSEESEEIVKELLKRGANPNLQDNWGQTALHKAVNSSSLKTLELLLKHKADINIKNNNGYTPLQLAVAESRLNKLKLLLNWGASIEVLDDIGNSLLHIAISFFEDKKIVEFLLKLGLDPYAENNDGKAPIHIAGCYGNKYIISVLCQLSSVPLDLQDDSGKTALYHYVEKGEGPISGVNWFLKSGANPDIPCNLGLSPRTILEQQYQYCISGIKIKKNL